MIATQYERKKLFEGETNTPMRLLSASNIYDTVALLFLDFMETSRVSNVDHDNCTRAEKFGKEQNTQML